MIRYPTLDGLHREVMDRISDGVLIENQQRVVYLNDAYATFLGYRSASDLRGVTISDIADEEDYDRLSWFGRCREEGKPAPYRYTFRARRRDRSIVTLDAAISTVSRNRQLFITTIVRIVHAEGASEQTALAPGLKPLSPREYEVVSHLLLGHRPKEIALNLGISGKTVATLRNRTFKKLGLRGDLDLFRYAAERGLLANGDARAQLAPKYAVNSISQVRSELRSEGDHGCR